MKTSAIVLIVLALVVVVGGIVWYTQNSTVAPAPAQQVVIPNPVSPEPSAQPTPTPASPAQVTATIANFAFSPKTITIKAGDTIVWTNNDSAAHTVTSDSGSFASGTLQTGGTYSHTFATLGTYAYHCAIHPNMHGTVVVTQ